MIPENAYDYCKDDISLIENYELAKADQNKCWICHHRLGIALNCSQRQLRRMRLYYARPAEELIFLTPEEHSRIHQIGKDHRGENNPFYGKKHS